MLRIEGIVKKYGPVTAVKGIGLHVPAGQCFGFLGPNGAGKTTTIKMIAGLLVPTAGRILVDGHDVQLEPEAAKSVTGFIPDKPFIYEKLTGREFLDFVLDIYGIPRTDVHAQRVELLKMFMLTDWQDSLIENYSHGMKQKLVITGALIQRPKLLVIDEPMVGLDPHGHKLVKDIFRNFCAEGNTIFMSTHTLTVAQEVCHRVAIIDKGEIVAIGTADELKEASHSESDRLKAIFLKLTEPVE